MRLLSLFPADRRLRILATDSEFHSFTRQAARLEEEGLAQVTRVATEPFADFPARFAEEIRRGGHDLIYFSQVFYNSGFAIRDLAPLVDAVPNEQTIVVIDGYHGFCALPADLQKIQARASTSPAATNMPWPAKASASSMCRRAMARGRGTPAGSPVSARSKPPTDRSAMAATARAFSAPPSIPSALYRLNAVMGLLSKLRLDIAEIHRHAHRLQASFARELAAMNSPLLNPSHLVVPIENRDRGNFLTFRSDNAGDLHKRLLAADIVTDHRGDRLRFGFGIYHDAEDIDRLMDALRRVLG